VLCERTLSGNGCSHGVPSAGKHEEEGVALRVDLVSAVTPERLPEEPAVVSEHVSVAVTQLALEPGRSFDIREEEGDRATGELRRVRYRCLVHVRPPPRWYDGLADF
jgi:hypothetical protein